MNEFDELLEELKTGICPHTGKPYNCARCQFQKTENALQKGFQRTFQFHASLSVAGWVERNPKLAEWGKLANCFDSIPGLTGRELRDYFQKLYSLGVRSIPIGNCDNYCYKHGCMKHILGESSLKKKDDKK